LSLTRISALITPLAGKSARHFQSGKETEFRFAHDCKQDEVVKIRI